MSRFGFRFDPLMSAARRAQDALHFAKRSCDAAKIAECQSTQDAAWAAIRARDAERKATRASNKALRAQGIDPTKKPGSMTAEQFDRARKTLRAAIEPQFPAYKAELFRILRAEAEGWLELLAKTDGNARAAAFEGADYRVLAEMEYKAEDPDVRRTARAKIQKGNAWLQNIRHWSTVATLRKGEHNDINRLGAIETK